MSAARKWHYNVWDGAIDRLDEWTYDLDEAREIACANPHARVTRYPVVSGQTVTTGGGEIVLLAQRLRFCGVISGSVSRRKGESKAEAISRAEATLNALMVRSARSFTGSKRVDPGPVVGLEPEDGHWGEW